MSKATRRKWFGVKTLYRVRTHGHPKNRDSYYDADTTLSEERVLLIQAKDSDEALQLAEDEAENYAKGVDTNIYGQEVVIDYLGAANCYAIDEKPGNKVEVYSGTALVSKKVSNNQLIDQLFGSKQKAGDEERRSKFVSRWIMENMRPIRSK